jgi:tape measure domain-containing protein
MPMPNKIVETIYRLRDNVSAGLEKIGLGWRKASKDTESATRTIETSTGRMSAGFTALVAIVKKFGAAILAVGVVGGLVKLKDALVDIVGIGEKFQNLEGQFAAVFGSTEKGAEALIRIRELADGAPQSFEDIAAAAVKLRQVGLDPLDGTLQALLDNNAALEGSQTDLLATIDALGKAALRGEVGLRALVSLSERGVPVFDLLGKALGKSEPELRRMAEAGQLGSDSIKLLIEELGKLRAGAAANEMQELASQLQKLRDRMEQIKASLVAGGPLDLIRQQFVDLNREIGEVAASPEFARLTESIRGSLTAGTQAIREFVDNVDLRELVTEFELFSEAVRASMQVLRGIGTVVGPTVAALDQLTLPLKQMKLVATIGLGAIADGLDAILPKAAAAEEAIKGTLSPLDAARNQIEAVKDVGDALVLAFEATRAGFDNLSAGAAQIALNLGDISGPAEEAREKIAALVEEVKTATPERIGDIALALGEVGSKSIAAGENLRSGLGAALAKLTGEDLLKFQTEATSAFGKFKVSADESGAVLETTLLVAMERLGVSGAKLGVTFTAAGEDIIAAFRVVAESAVATSDQIEAAFSGALKKATTVAEAQALGDALQRAAEQGRVSLDATTRATIALNDQITKLKNATDPLADAFTRLGIVSQKELDRLANTARRDFDSIVVAARAGEASLDDVGRAFVAMAQKQLDSVRNASEWERKQVEGAIRSQAATLGLRDALSEVGLAGAEAGDLVAQGAEKATGALRDTAAAAGSVASAASDVSATGGDVVNNFNNITFAAQGTTAALDGVSEAFRAAAAAQAGQVTSTGGRESTVFAELQRQSAALEEQIALVREQNAEYDDLEQRIRSLRGQYQFLSDDRLRQLAQEQLRLEENQARREEALKREQEQMERLKSQGADAAQRSQGSDRPAVGSGGIAKVELTVKNATSGSPLRVQDQDLYALARELTPLIVSELKMYQSVSGR